MANSLSQHTCLPQRRASVFSRLGAALALRRQRHNLAQLSDAQLKDIGIDRTQADTEARRSMWDAPEHWMR
ncbi:DUF1127 domain-containing protein [Epibacterium sp. MM17-32]|uniref:DUF1127 domain-containing protein n=1 Tax=Epibacterium sp. MM17-32 TaxID=2917734 RepID=UPI001EF59909|nr:DUF1127 domain-containing protein [Epibacterium sp. MM17-32]MCG7627464.1 DUF1127 domain-containing protein [Epibacterium sp. MM17-32]